MKRWTPHLLFPFSILYSLFLYSSQLASLAWCLLKPYFPSCLYWNLTDRLSASIILALVYLSSLPSMLLAFANTTAQGLTDSGLFICFSIWSYVQGRKSQERRKSYMPQDRLWRKNAPFSQAYRAGKHFLFVFRSFLFLLKVFLSFVF